MKQKDTHTKSSTPTKKASKPRGRPSKDYADVQRSIQLGSPEILAKKILNTPLGKIKLR
ncbi:MAG: hypothetical protein OXI05_06995 [Bacteroidota bacterium]|nr:hypothetical protein [Bacteroidota bacterium]MDE2645567.1 hypothetical protein [Bacteroidota bacterium]